MAGEGPQAWPRGGGEMAARVRAFDWSATLLGPSAAWPDALRTAVEMMLASPIVSSLAIGPQRLFLYNDAAAPHYGDRHPGALGQPLAQTFAHAFHLVAPFYDRAYEGEGVHVPAQALDPGRSGAAEVFEAGLTPVRDAHGEVIAVFMTGFARGRAVRAEAVERAKAETALREREAELARVQRIGGVGGLDVNVAGGLHGRRSPEYLRLHGLPPEVMEESHAAWRMRVHPEDLAEAERNLLAALDGDACVYESEYRIVRPDRTVRWIAARADIERDASGKAVRLVGAHIDVTEQKRVQEALRESEEQQRLTVELVPALLWWADPKGREIRVNERWRSYTGQSDAEVHDFGWLDMVHPDDRLSTKAAFAAGEPLECEQRIRRLGEGYRWHVVRHVPVRDERGAVTRWFGAAIDIHESKLAAEALDASERRLQTLMEGVPQLVWRAVDDGRWTWASPQWTDFTGQAEADSHGLGWLDPVHPEDRERVRTVWDGAVERGEFHADYRICHPVDHRYRWFQTRAAPVRNDKGEIIEWLGTSTDVEDLRALQERQRVLLHELQHRVRNTLAVIRSLAASTGESSETVQEFSSHLEGRLNALARTQMVLTRAPGQGVDLEGMIREELLAQTAREAQVEVEGPEVRLSAKAAEVLTLAVHELATNAVKYGALSTPQGRVRVRWTTQERDGRTWVRLAWEEGGVRVASAAPRREGFGTELIEMRVPYELRGRGELQFRPGGVRCEIEFPNRSGESILQTSAPDEAPVSGD